VCANCHAMIHRAGECRPIVNSVTRERSQNRGAV